MIKSYINKSERFVELFNDKTGTMIRSSVIKGEVDTGINPFSRDFPSLIDIGIMGHCKHGLSGKCLLSGTQCYQSGSVKQKPNMPFEDYLKIMKEAEGKVWEVALGGCGDPDQHENFEDILIATRDHGIVPNFTTSGMSMTDEIAKISKKYCGAVAVSEYGQDYTYRAIDTLNANGVKTNIHYILGENTYKSILRKLDTGFYNGDGLNAIIFLLHKNVGLGQKNNVLTMEHAKEFFEYIDSNRFEFKIGFDSCSAPAIVNLCKSINPDLFDTCEGGRFSCYITADMIATPCSFDQELKWGYDIKESSLLDAWKSIQFSSFRNKLSGSCGGCKDRLSCMGGCPVTQDIVLCERNCR